MDPFKKSELNSIYHDILSRSEVWGSSFFKISITGTVISIRYRHLRKVIIQIGILIVFLTLWFFFVLSSAWNWFNLILFTLSLGFGLSINLFHLFTTGICIHPVILDIKSETLTNMAENTPFSKISELLIVQTATEFMSGERQYCGLRLKPIELKEKSIIFGRYFSNCKLIANLGHLIQNIFEIHGLQIQYLSQKIEFDNNFEHLSTIDL